MILSAALSNGLKRGYTIFLATSIGNVRFSCTHSRIVESVMGEDLVW